MARPNVGSMKGAPLTPALYDYMVTTFATRERDLLERMARRAQQAGVPMIMISPEQAALLRVLLRLMGARRVLDVGTLFGYSAAAMAMGLREDGRVVTIEQAPLHARIARENFAKEQLDDRIELVEGPAVDAMERMDSDSYDFVFVDADKTHYLTYLREGIRLVREGGAIGFDNAFAFGKIADRLGAGDPDRRDVEALREFNRVFATHPALESTLVPVGDGMALGRVHKESSQTRAKGSAR